MGLRYSAICNACGTEFVVHDGGGFTFHLLHCDACGRERTILLEEIGEAHLRYLKGLGVPYSMATADHDRRMREPYPRRADGKGRVRRGRGGVV
jgi:hypothetical protein